MKFPRKVIVGIAILATIALSAAARVPQAAASRPSAAPHVVVAVVPMHITGFDPVVAKAHGYVIRTNAAGRQYAVKAGAKPGATPAGIVYGDCGSSWLYYVALGSRRVWVYTGFDVTAPAVYYWWRYWMLDNGGISSHTHSGIQFSSSWSTTDTWGGMTAGWSEAWVDASSYAVLASGAVCTSAGPSDTTTIY
jgi:hypothetical protein